MERRAVVRPAKLGDGTRQAWRVNTSRMCDVCISISRVLELWCWMKQWGFNGQESLELFVLPRRRVSTGICPKVGQMVDITNCPETQYLLSNKRLSTPPKLFMHQHEHILTSSFALTRFGNCPTGTSYQDKKGFYLLSNPGNKLFA